MVLVLSDFGVTDLKSDERNRNWQIQYDRRKIKPHKSSPKLHPGFFGVIDYESEVTCINPKWRSQSDDWKLKLVVLAKVSTVGFLYFIKHMYFKTWLFLFASTAMVLQASHPSVILQVPHVLEDFTNMLKRTIKRTFMIWK